MLTLSVRDAATTEFAKMPSASAAEMRVQGDRASRCWSVAFFGRATETDRGRGCQAAVARTETYTAPRWQTPNQFGQKALVGLLFAL